MSGKGMVLLGIAAICLGLVAQAAGSVQSDVVEVLMADPEAFPMSRDVVQETLGQPDQVETVPGFSAPMEIYIIEGSKELSHIYFVYGAGKDGNLTCAIGMGEKGLDLDSLMAWEWRDEETIILRENTFAVLSFSPEGPLWQLLEERTLQGELLIISTLMYPKDLISYVVAVYGEKFKKPLEEALQGTSGQ